MYLTRIILNPSRRATRTLTGSRHRLHAAVQTLFPAVPADLPELGDVFGETTEPTVTAPTSSRTLWRLDQAPGTSLIYIVSSAAPDKEAAAAFVGEYSWPDDAKAVATVEYDGIAGRLTTGSRFAYRTVVNPTQTVAQDPTLLKENGKRVRGTVEPIHGEQAQLNWWAARGDANGFQLVNNDLGGTTTRIEKAGNDQFRGSDRNGKRNDISLAITAITGILEITDVDKFRAALINGVGRGRGYGCGLITIARA